MNELENQENDINTDTTKRFETDKQVMMIFDTVGNENGDGGDCDGEGDEMLLLDCIKNKSFEDAIKPDLTEADVNAYDEGDIQGALKNLQPSQTPSDFTPYEPTFGAPPLKQIDNPGKWSQFTCKPKYLKEKHPGHFTPSSATIFPANENRVRNFGDLELYYDGFNANEVDLQNFVFVGANSQNHLPESRRGKLNFKLVKRQGLTIEQVKAYHALFLFNLLLPIHIPKLSGVENDKRMPFFSIICAWTNVYAFSRERNQGRSYGHDFQILEEELVW